MISPAKTTEGQAGITLDLEDEAATTALAKRLACQARLGDVYALFGDLGAGKTSFARAFINALPGESEEVPSPSFTLVQTYQRGSLEVWHVDLYRLSGPEETLELGLEEGFSEAIALIEWPERLGEWLPETRLDLAFAYAHDSSEDGRRITLTPQGHWRADEPNWLQDLMEKART